MNERATGIDSNQRFPSVHSFCAFLLRFPTALPFCAFLLRFPHATKAEVTLLRAFVQLPGRLCRFYLLLRLTSIFVIGNLVCLDPSS